MEQILLPNGHGTDKAVHFSPCSSLLYLSIKRLLLGSVCFPLSCSMYFKHGLEKSHFAERVRKRWFGRWWFMLRKAIWQTFTSDRQWFQHLLHNTFRKLVGVGGLMLYSLRHRIGMRQNIFYLKVGWVEMWNRREERSRNVRWKTWLKDAMCRR